MLDVCLLGTSGMMPLPKRALTALMTRFNGSSLLIDCGEGTQIAIKEKGWSFKPIDTLCLTHYHADHVSGPTGQDFLHIGGRQESTGQSHRDVDPALQAPGEIEEEDRATARVDTVHNVDCWICVGYHRYLHEVEPHGRHRLDHRQGVLFRKTTLHTIGRVQLQSDREIITQRIAHGPVDLRQEAHPVFRLFTNEGVAG